jgi:hypothetical protein
LKQQGRAAPETPPDRDGGHDEPPRQLSSLIDANENQDR